MCTCTSARLSAWNIVDLPIVSMPIQDVRLRMTSSPQCCCETATESTKQNRSDAGGHEEEMEWSHCQGQRQGLRLGQRPYLALEALPLGLFR